MANLNYKNQKKPLDFTKGEINRAAKDIRHGVVSDERLTAIKVIQNFREFHLYPLMLLKNHLVRTSAKISGKTNVARRLKRLSTIINKLERPTLDGADTNSIKLTRMQDIAGCRAIVKDLKKLKALQVKLENSKSVHKIIRTKEYLTPKDSGYGGVHLVYSCYEGQEDDHEWKRAKVEVQLRTELQHAWATSLEIIDTLEQINLKTSHYGHDEWREFFRMKEIDIALEHLNEADLDNSIAVSILVSASDVRALKQAYPNYFGSTKQFINFVNEQCALIVTECA